MWKMISGIHLIRSNSDILNFKQHVLIKYKHAINSVFSMPFSSVFKLHLPPYPKAFWVRVKNYHADQRIKSLKLSNSQRKSSSSLQKYHPADANINHPDESAKKLAQSFHLIHRSVHVHYLYFSSG